MECRKSAKSGFETFEWGKQVFDSMASPLAGLIVLLTYIVEAYNDTFKIKFSPNDDLSPAT